MVTAGFGVCLVISVLATLLFALRNDDHVNSNDWSISLLLPFIIMGYWLKTQTSSQEAALVLFVFINLGTNAQRGTATSTYLTTWDLGLGIGIFSGGMLAEHFSFSAAYLVASASVLVSLVFFVVVVTPHYQRNKLR